MSLTDGQDEKSAQVNEANVAVSILPHEDPLYDVNVDIHTGLYDGVHRGLEQRQMQMIGLASTIGTGLFLGSGKAIAHSGPAGALLAYMHVSAVIWCMIVSLGEMCIYAPISGGYIHFAERWLNPAAGFALGYQVVFNNIVSVPTELISASILISYWDNNYTNAHSAAYITGLMVLCALINYFGVRWFGEAEFYFSISKIALIVGLIIGGIVVDLGGSPTHDRIGFRFWDHPGAFAEYHYTGNLGKFCGWFVNLLQAAFSFGGIETIAVAAGEVKNPRVSVTKAIRRLFYRIALFYILGIFVIGLLVPYDNPDLLQSTGTAASSPFVIAFQLAGIKVLPSIINAGVLVSAFSASNTQLYGASRQLYGMSLRGYAPKIFAKTTKRGLPIVSLVFFTAFMPLSYMSLGAGANTALNWCSNLVTLTSFITWGTICVTYLRFKKACEVQGVDRTKFHYWNRWQPWPAYFALFWCGVITLFNGWEVFTGDSLDVTDFIIDYINIPIFALMVVGYLVWRRPKHLKPAELDLISNIPTDEEVAYEEPPPKNAFMKVVNFFLT